MKINRMCPDSFFLTITNSNNNKNQTNNNNFFANSSNNLKTMNSAKSNKFNILSTMMK